MRIDKEQATILRRSGMSYSAIKAKMGIPRSTLSKWFKDERWSNNIAIECIDKSRNGGAIRFAVLNTIKRNRLDSVRKEARQDAMLDFEELKYHPLFISGVIAYWMHGDLTSRNRVCFSSSDPSKVKLFKLFLERICGIERPKVWINLRKGNLVFLAESFWTTECGLKEEYFGKTVISGNKFRNPLDVMGHKVGKIGNNHGVCNMVVNSAYLKNKIVKWKEMMVQELINEKYNAGIV